MKSELIQKKVDLIENEIGDLRSQLVKIENKLSKSKLNIDFNKPLFLEELKSLKSDKDLVLEVIEEKQRILTSLKKELEATVKAENREQTIKELIDHAESAEALEAKFRTKILALDKLLSERIPELVNIRSEWERTAIEFCNTAESSGLGKGLKQSTVYTKVRNDKEFELNSSKLIEELVERGTNLDSVLSESVLKSQYFNHQRSAEPLEMTFREVVFDAMSQKNIY